MPDGVHAEFAQDKRMLAGEILQPQQITLEILLVVEIDIKTTKIGILRQQIFGGRIGGIGKKGIRIDRASYANQFFHEFNHATPAEPARHSAGNFVADQVTKDCRMPYMCADATADGFGDLFPGRSFTQELDMFFPRKRHQHAHPRGSTTIKKPARRRMINPHNVQTDLAHESKIAIDLLRSSEVISFRVRLERTIGNAFDKELFVSFKKEFRHRANSRVCHACHV